MAIGGRMRLHTPLGARGGRKVKPSSSLRRLRLLPSFSAMLGVVPTIHGGPEIEEDLGSPCMGLTVPSNVAGDRKRSKQAVHGRTLGF